MCCGTSAVSVTVDPPTVIRSGQSVHPPAVTATMYATKMLQTMSAKL